MKVPDISRTDVDKGLGIHIVNTGGHGMVDRFVKEEGEHVNRIEKMCIRDRYSMSPMNVSWSIMNPALESLPSASALE